MATPLRPPGANGRVCDRDLPGQAGNWLPGVHAPVVGTFLFGVERTAGVSCEPGPRRIRSGTGWAAGTVILAGVAPPLSPREAL